MKTVFMPATSRLALWNFIHPWCLSEVWVIRGVYSVDFRVFMPASTFFICLFAHSFFFYLPRHFSRGSRGLAIRRWIKSSGDLRRYTKYTFVNRQTILFTFVWRHPLASVFSQIAFLHCFPEDLRREIPLPQEVRRQFGGSLAGLFYISGGM